MIFAGFFAAVLREVIETTHSHPYPDVIRTRRRMQKLMRSVGSEFGAISAVKNPRSLTDVSNQQFSTDILEITDNDESMKI